MKNFVEYLHIVRYLVLTYGANIQSTAYSGGEEVNLIEN